MEIFENYLPVHGKPTILQMTCSTYSKSDKNSFFLLVIWDLTQLLKWLCLIPNLHKRVKSLCTRGLF